MASILDDRFEQQLDNAVGGNLITASHEVRKNKFGWHYKSAEVGQYARGGFYYVYVPEEGHTNRCELRFNRNKDYASLLIRSDRIQNKEHRKTVKVRTMAEVIAEVEKIGITIPENHQWTHIWDC